MLRINRGSVSSLDSADDRISRVTVRMPDGELRPAISYPGLLGQLKCGDEVLINSEALDLKLGSGGFDFVIANLSKNTGDGAKTNGAHVMKLNYTPLQHSVELVEEQQGDVDEYGSPGVVVLALHSQLSAAAFALQADASSARIGYIQTAGGALPGAYSDTVAKLLADGILADHVTVAPCFGGQHEAATTIGALQAASLTLDCDLVLVGPGPGIQGSGSALGHGGMQALESAHAALCLSERPLLCPRASAADSRERHRGLSHHTATVLRLVLGSVDIAVAEETLNEDLKHALDKSNAEQRHTVCPVSTDDLFDSFVDSDLPATSMGRGPTDDPTFFRQALAAGRVGARRFAS